MSPNWAEGLPAALPAQCLSWGFRSQPHFMWKACSLATKLICTANVHLSATASISWELVLHWVHRHVQGATPYQLSCAQKPVGAWTQEKELAACVGSAQDKKHSFPYHLPAQLEGMGLLCFSSRCPFTLSLTHCRLEKKHEISEGKIVGKHRFKSFWLYESMKPTIRCQQNIAEYVTRLLLASDIWEMLLQGTRINTRSSLKHPNSSESITIRLKSYTMQAPQQYLCQGGCLSLNSTRKMDPTLFYVGWMDVWVLLSTQLSLANHLPHILSIPLCQHSCYEITCSRLGPDFPG